MENNSPFPPFYLFFLPQGLAIGFVLLRVESAVEEGN